MDQEKENCSKHKNLTQTQTVNYVLVDVMVHFLAATKQLQEYLCLSVCPSVHLSICHTFMTMFLSLYHI